MHYLGNIDLLQMPMTAFLASSTIPTDMVLRCYDWAKTVSRDYASLHTLPKVTPLVVVACVVNFHR